MIITLLMLCFSVIHATTNLQIQCNSSSAVHTYWGTSCYIVHTELKYQALAKLSCKDILGYSGHLVHIRSLNMLSIINGLMSAAGSLGTIWIGTEYIGASGTYPAGWYYTTPTRRYDEIASYIPWNSGGSSTSAGWSMIYQPNSGSTDATPRTNYPFICEYEEQYAHEITAAEIYCNGLPTPSNNISTYVDGSCFVGPIQAPYLAGTTLATALAICPSVSGLVSRPAHLNTTGKFSLALSIGRMKACTGNNCAEEGGYSWFWATPEGYRWPANTKQNGFWAAGYPSDVSSARNNAILTGATLGYLDTNIYQGTLCEYLAPYSFTNFEKACLLSSNPSAIGYSSCFTLNRNATTFNIAQGQCTEFTSSIQAGRQGFLARVNTVEMATFLSSSLWANSGLPSSMPLFSGLRLNGSQWYWMYPDGTKSLANSTNLPWNATQPQSGDCASVGQNGLLITTSCTANQWFICQYRNPIYETYKGTGNVKGAPSAAISETSDLSMTDCKQICENNGECNTFAYSISSRTCQLIRGTSGVTVPASGFTWFQLVK